MSDDLCLMPIGYDKVCLLPGDHYGACGPVSVRCDRCDHGPSVHTGGHGTCWQTPCTCPAYRDPVAAAAIEQAKSRHPSGKQLPGGNAA